MKRTLDIRFYPPNQCPRCRNKSIEMYTYFNSPMGYSRISDMFMQSKKMPEDYLNKQEIYTFRCRVCGMCFPIKWEDGYPLPDFHPQSLNRFMADFKDANKGKGK